MHGNHRSGGQAGGRIDSEAVLVVGVEKRAADGNNGANNHRRTC